MDFLKKKMKELLDDDKDKAKHETTHSDGKQHMHTLASPSEMSTLTDICVEHSRDGQDGESQSYHGGGPPPAQHGFGGSPPPPPGPQLPPGKSGDKSCVQQLTNGRVDSTVGRELTALLLP
jgi:hypothetical protein